MAEAYNPKNEDSIIIVNKDQIDPNYISIDGNEKDSEKMNLGKFRFPVFVRIADFAELINLKPELSLIEFLGFHKWNGYTLQSFLSYF